MLLYDTSLDGTEYYAVCERWVKLIRNYLEFTGIIEILLESSGQSSIREFCQ